MTTTNLFLKEKNKARKKKGVKNPFLLAVYFLAMHHDLNVNTSCEIDDGWAFYGI